MSRYLVLLVILAPTRAPAAEPEFVFTPEAVERSGPPSGTLARALRLYERRDFHAASILLYQVIKGETGDAEAHRQRAEFTLGKTLYHLGYHTAALTFFDRVLDKGERHRYHNATLKWLAALSRRLPESAGILKRVGGYTPAHLAQPALVEVRDRLRYLMGRHRYSKGRLDEAASLFEKVAPEADVYPRARYMLGVVNVRLERPERALAAFRVVIRKAGATREGRRLREMARLAAARVLFALGRFDSSLDQYDRIPQGSTRWLTAVFESGWTSFHRGKFARALGKLHTLRAPYFERHFFPEAHILQAVIYWRHCRWDRTRAALDTFNRRYPRLKQQIDSLLERNREANELYRLARRLRRGEGGELGLEEQVARLARLALDDRSLVKQFAYVERLGRDLARFREADPAWRSTGVAAEVLQDLALQRSLAEVEAGQLASARLRRVSREIRKLTQQAIKVEYETIRAEKDWLQAELQGYLVRRSGGSAAPFKVDDEHQFWPFEGPYAPWWRDELDYYYVRVRSSCRDFTPRAAVKHPMAAMKVKDTPLDVSF